MAGARETPGERAARDGDRDRAMAEARQEVRAIEQLWLPDGVYTPPPQQTVVAAATPEPLEFVDAPTAPTYGRRPTGDERVTMVASAARIDLSDRKMVEAMRRRRQAWQTEAWDYYDEVPEIGYEVDFIGNLLSKLRLYAAVRPDPKAAPVSVDDEKSGVPANEQAIATEVLSHLRSMQGGQASLLQSLAVNFEVAGEAYLHGHEDAETGDDEWNVRSVDELVVEGDQYGLRTYAGANQIQRIPKDDIVIRLWERHPRFGNLSKAAMRRVLGEAENVLLLSREIRATTQSRLSNGILVFPQEMSLGPVDPTRQGEAGDDGFLASMQQAMVTGVQEPGSAAAFVPISVMGPAEHIKEIRHIKISRELDSTLDQRIEGRVLRIARGLNMPVEVTTGLQNTTFANAAAVKKSEWDAHGEPRATLIVDALTSGYYQWMLEEAGMDHDRAREHFIWYDPTDCLSAPDPVDSADHGVAEGLIGNEAWRRIRGYAETDAPTAEELAQQLAIKMIRQDPMVAAILIRDSGIAPNILIPAPASGVIDTTTREVTGGTTTPDSALLAAALLAAARPHRAAATAGARLGRRLAAIDRDLRLRLRAAAERELQHTLERAGNMVRRKAKDGATREVAAQAGKASLVAAALGRQVVVAMGLTDDTLLGGEFDDLAAEFGVWVDVAYGQALEELERVVGALDGPVRQQVLQQAAASGRTAAQWLQQEMGRLAAAKLYDPTPGFVPQGESDASSVPAWLVRYAVGLAGGDDPKGGGGAPLLSQGGGPVMGIGTGPNLISEATGVNAVEAYQWDYGSAPRNPFEPHLALDGTVAVNFDDEVWANDEGWPDLPYYQPGDHDGCTCDVLPIFLVAADEETADPDESE